jgi:hypothetical protein
MRFLTWLRFASFVERYFHAAVPVDGMIFRESLPEDPPCGPRRRSYSLPENGLEEAASSGGKNKWIYVR